VELHRDVRDVVLADPMDALAPIDDPACERVSGALEVAVVVERVLVVHGAQDVVVAAIDSACVAPQDVLDLHPADDLIDVHDVFLRCEGSAPRACSKEVLVTVPTSAARRDHYYDAARQLTS